MSKVELNEAVRLWNTAVDEYIASDVDSRPTETIENAAKVGVAGGPLHRRCEATGCPNLEFRNGVTLSLCSGCRTVGFSFGFASKPLISCIRPFIAVAPVKKTIGKGTGRRAVPERYRSRCFHRKKCTQGK